MATVRKSRVGVLLIGLPVFSNVVSFIIFAPLFAPRSVATSPDYQRAGILAGIAILVIEVVAVFLLSLLLRGEDTSFKGIVNFQPNRVRSYLIMGSIALLPTLVTGWLYSLGQAQAGVESNWLQLTRGEIVLWYVLTPIAVALLEETIWRGYAIPRTKGVWRSLLFTSLSFALFHGVFNPLVVVATFVQGLIWGWTYQRTESTIPSMVLHFLSRYLALVF
jgi:membrane protease YdiL (CAAX protease family)